MMSWVRGLYSEDVYGRFGELIRKSGANHEERHTVLFLCLCVEGSDIVRSEIRGFFVGLLFLSPMCEV